MSTIKVTIDASKVGQYLDKLPFKLKSALDTGLRKATAIIEGESKKQTPVDSGRLRSSIHSSFGWLKSTISTNTNYAVYVHEGTRYMTGRPFMMRGLNASRGEIESVLDTEISRAIK